MKALLKSFVRKTSQESTPQEKLFEACVEGDFEKFQQALKDGADIHYAIEDDDMAFRFGHRGNTALIQISMWDSLQGHEDIFDYIIAQPDVNLLAVNRYGYCAISNSVYKERADRVHKIEAALERQEKAAKAKAKKPINPQAIRHC